MQITYCTQGRAPSMVQQVLGASFFVTYSLPPSSTSSPLMPRNIEGSCTERILQTPLPVASGIHCWLGLPVLVHWITFAPESLLSPAMSRKRPFCTLWMRQPFSCLTHLHLWLNLLLISYWMMRSPGLMVPPGTSRALPDMRLTSTKLPLTVLLPFTSSIRQRWFSPLGSKVPNLRAPSRQMPLSPLALVLIQQQVKKPGKLALEIENNCDDFCFPNSSRISLPSSLSTNPVLRFTNSQSSISLPTFSIRKSCVSSCGLKGAPTTLDSSYLLGSVSLGLRAKSSALLMSAQTLPFLNTGAASISYLYLPINIGMTGKDYQYLSFLSLSTTLLTRSSFSLPLALYRFSITSLLIFTVQLLPCDRPVNSPSYSSSPRIVSPPSRQFSYQRSLLPVSLPSAFTSRSVSRKRGKLSLPLSLREVGYLQKTKSRGSPSSISCRFSNLSFSRLISSMRRRLKRSVLAWMSWQSLELGESYRSVGAPFCCWCWEVERSASLSLPAFSQKQLKSQNCSLRPFLMLSLPYSMNMELSLTISDCWHFLLNTYSTASWTNSLEYCGNLELQNSLSLSMDSSKGLISLSSWDMSSCGYLDSLNLRISSQYLMRSFCCSISIFCLMQLSQGVSLRTCLYIRY